MLIFVFVQVDAVQTFPYHLKQQPTATRLTLEEAKKPSRQGIGLIQWNTDGSLVALRDGTNLFFLLLPLC